MYLSRQFPRKRESDVFDFPGFGSRLLRPGSAGMTSKLSNKYLKRDTKRLPLATGHLLPIRGCPLRALVF